MRKLLLGLLTIILLAFSVYVAFYGVSFAGLTVNGIPTIKEENAKLEKGSVISQEDVNYIFSDINIIINFNSKLLEKLDQKLANFAPCTCFSKEFNFMVKNNNNK